MLSSCRLREEFAENLVHPDPVPLARIDAPSVQQSESNAGSGCGQLVGGCSQERQAGDGRRRRETSPARSAQSTDQSCKGEPGGAGVDKKVL